MSIVVTQSVLTDLSVKEAMRRQVVRVPQTAPVGNAINDFIKHKVNSVLVVNGDDQPAGVASKTDIMGAYYADLPIDTALEAIMVSPPIYCRPDVGLDKALATLRSLGIYRLYVRDGDDGPVVGALAYPDIVGLLYRYCHGCDRSLHRRGGKAASTPGAHFRVRDVMTPSVVTCKAGDSLQSVMEGLSSYRFGAVLIVDNADRALGVVSKTDLMLAYKHGLSAQQPASDIMGAPVQACATDDYLVDAIRQMITAEIQRLFVYREGAEQMAGVLSLSDAARLRSGSCQACVSSRIKVEASG